jgi:hypothetical protein
MRLPKLSSVIVHETNTIDYEATGKLSRDQAAVPFEEFGVVMEISCWWTKVTISEMRLGT